MVGVQPTIGPVDSTSHHAESNDNATAGEEFLLKIAGKIGTADATATKEGDPGRKNAHPSKVTVEANRKPVGLLKVQDARCTVLM